MTSKLTQITSKLTSNEPQRTSVNLKKLKNEPQKTIDSPQKDLKIDLKMNLKLTSN